MDRTAQQLADLAHILNDRVVVATPAADAIDRHLARLRLDRVQQLTQHIERHSDRTGDQVDGIALRVLVHEYVTALAHLRAATQEAASRIEAVPPTIKDVRRCLQQEVDLQEKRPASAEPSDR